MSLINQKISKLLKVLTAFVKPDTPGAVPFTVSAATQLTEREGVSGLFNYKHFDQETNLCFMDDPDAPAVGFVLGITPLMVAGVDTEPQLEAVINALPPESIIQFGKLVTPQIGAFLKGWSDARLKTNRNPLLRQIAVQRKEFMETTASGPSMLPETRLHPRMMQWYVAVRIPYRGDVADHLEMGAYLKQVLDARHTVQGSLRAAQLSSKVYEEEEVKSLLRELLNPHLEPHERVAEQVTGASLAQDIVSRNTRLTVQPDGRLGFSRESGEPDVCVTCLTVDTAPHTLYLPMMARTLGDPEAWDERITCPYWAYTTIHVLHPDNAKDSLTAKFGLLNKQTMSESPWFRSMMGHLYERRDSAQGLLKQTNEGRTLVRAYTGINLYTPVEDARAQTEYVKGLYRRAGFRLSEEAYISLPVFIASMPLQYTPAMDPPNRGLQRAWLMSSLNAASMVQIQGDWRGTGEANGGLLLVSRSGQVATFDLLQTTINYNFVVVAASGSGKSFLTNEIVCDFLSKGGIARLIDVGRSYARFCEVMGGENIVFSPENPLSLNPFTDIRTEADLNEMLPMLKDLLRLMAYPLTPEEHTPAYQYQLIEKAITEAWRNKGNACELSDVVEWLDAYNGDNSNRAQDLAMQLEPYSHGRYRKWFSGPRTVQFSKPLVVIELEELKQDSSLQAVVLQLVMFQTTKEMYLSDRRLPKLLAIDEAWDLMGGLKTGRFIETAFRRMRKYNGIAGVITQSFEDFEKSPAARAAIENAAWQFILFQRAESIEHAVAHKRISTDPGAVALIKSVRSGQGFSEVFVRGEQGSGLYRFVTDKHSYYTFTTKPKDINRLNDLVDKGATLPEAIDELAMQDYKRMWG
ncbi:type IV secretion system protein TraC [Nostoc sp. CHAB 5834]|nr:type IV secretion system protein TraC [Nostoc sp. CHAB 5834]